MSATYQLFESWKKAQGITSDYKGALALGVSKGTVSLWKSGRNAEPAHIAKMARGLNQEPGAWIAAAQAEKTTSVKDKKEWLALAKRLGWAAGIALVIGSATAPVAQAQGGFCADKPGPMYIMSSWLQRLRRAFATLFGHTSGESAWEDLALA